MKKGVKYIIWIGVCVACSIVVIGSEANSKSNRTYITVSGK